jgi:hypothetical protein
MVCVRHGGTVRGRLREEAARAGAEGGETIPNSHSSFRPTPAELPAHPGNSDYFRVIPSNSDHRKKPPHPFLGRMSCRDGPVRHRPGEGRSPGGGGRSNSRIKTNQVGHFTGPLRAQPQKNPLFTGVLTALRVKNFGRRSDAPPPPFPHSLVAPQRSDGGTTPFCRVPIQVNKGQ